ncbi:hypothetical protein KXR53_23495 [Inquilinus limosus]|uniref:hypothetical protein n=1 Tax=Inquilinus limosus TaxID=171674 RepID=UPI003F19202E
MAGFLTRIAARLGRPEGQLRPRTLSLFEPVATAAADLVERPLQESSGERVDEVDAQAIEVPPATAEPESPRKRRTGARSVAPGPAVPDRHADPQPEMADIPSAARGASIAPRRPAPPAAEPVDGFAATRDAPAPTAREPGRAIRPAGIAARPRTLRIEETAEADMVERMEERPAAGRRGPAPPLPQSIGIDAATQHDRREMPAVTARPAPAASGILQAPAAARIVPALLPPPQRAQRSEPAIHVTIGRVEVKAVATPSSDAARPERPSPVMSLDEYLRNRAR